MLKGLNHITIQVADLDRSMAFYTQALGMKPHARWAFGAYLTLGELWFCLLQGKSSPARDYSHIAFDLGRDDFSGWAEKIREQGIPLWKENESEGDSLYLLDPDGHQLEIHCGDLSTRLASLTPEDYPGLEMFGTGSDSEQREGN